MSHLEMTGRTVEEAIEKALQELSVRRDNVEVTVIDEPVHGLLGIIGAKSARVKVTIIKDKVQYLRSLIEALLADMPLTGEVNVSESDSKIEVMINGDNVGVLIGRRGRTLSDFQYLINVIMRRQYGSIDKMIVVDVEGYRARREKTLVQLANSVAQKVLKDGFEQTLEPMNPQERRIIHMALQETPGVETYSAGKEPYRKVIIAPR